MQQALAVDLYHGCNKSCKEMGGATSVMPVIRDVFSQQAADTTQWADTIDWTVCCDWLQVASSRIILYNIVQQHANEGCETCSVVATLIGVYMTLLRMTDIRRALCDNAELSSSSSPASSALRHTLIRPGVTRIHQTNRQRCSTGIYGDPSRVWCHTLAWHTYTSATCFTTTIITARSVAERGIAKANCPSVCLSVTLKYRGHIGWNSAKIISRLISLIFSLSADPNKMDLLQREHPQILAGIGVG